MLKQRIHTSLHTTLIATSRTKHHLKLNCKYNGKGMGSLYRKCVEYSSMAFSTCLKQFSNNNNQNSEHQTKSEQIVDNSSNSTSLSDTKKSAHSDEKSDSSTFLNVLTAITGSENVRERIELATANLRKMQAVRDPKRPRTHIYVFYLVAVLVPLNIFMWFLKTLDDYVMGKQEAEIGAFLEREGNYTLFNLDMYAKKPTKDIRETQALNREKFYSNRELSRLNFEKKSYEQYVQNKATQSK